MSATGPKVYQSYRGQLPIELELINCMSDCRKQAIVGATTNNYAGFIEAVDMFYSTIPPEIQDELILTTEYKKTVEGLPSIIRIKMEKLRPLERSNALRHLSPQYAKENAKLLFRAITRHLYHHDLLLKGRSQIEAEITMEDE